LEYSYVVVALVSIPNLIALLF